MAKVFLDANVVIYLVGAAHPNKVTASTVLQRLATNADKLITDAEVYQEILHRYSAINRKDAIQPAFDLLSLIVDETLDITLPIVESAKTLLLAYTNLSARDSIHLAVMQSQGVTQIFSFDTGFDVAKNVQRLYS